MNGAHHVAIVGTGAFAHTHAEALARTPRLALAGFVGARPDGAEALADAFGGRAYPDLAAALDDDRLAGVIIATPHDNHAALGVAALAAGKHVLIEKPLAPDLAGCDALIAAERAGPARAMVGHLMRHAPAHIQARRLITDGALGEVVAADSRRLIPWDATGRRPWQLSATAGGGMWLIQGVHVIDQLTYLIGARAETAFGVAATRFHPGQDADDFGLAQLRFGSVHAAVTLAGTPPRAPQVWTEIHGTRANLRVSHRGSLALDDGTGWVDRLDPVDDHWRATLDGEMAAFADLIDGVAVPTDLDYGRYVVAVVAAVRRSAQSGAAEAVT